MNWLSRLISLALYYGVCLACPNSLAQDLVMKTREVETTLRDGYIIQKHLYTVEDGLASNEVLGGLQDSDGFIWLATRNGLNRFDGKQFKLFNTQVGRLAHNYIASIAKDENKHLFLRYGLLDNTTLHNRTEIFDLQTHTIMPVKKVYPNLPFHPDSIMQIQNEAQKVYFVVAPFQIWELVGKTFTLKIDVAQYIDKQKFRKYDILGGDYVLYKGNKIIINIKDKDIPLIFMTDNKTHLLPKKYPSADTEFEYFMSPDESLLVNIHEQGSNLITRKLTLQNDTLPFSLASSFSEKAPIFFMDNVAFSQDRKLIIKIIEGKRKIYSHHSWGRYSTIYEAESKTTPTAKTNLADLFLFYFQDTQQNIWLCARYGLIKIKVQKNKFDQYFTVPASEKKLRNQARGIYADTAGNVYAHIWDKVQWQNRARQVRELKTTTRINYPIEVRGNALYGFSTDLFVMDKKLLSPPQYWQTDKGRVWAFYFLSDDEILLGSTVLEIYNLKTKESRFLENKYISKSEFFYRFFKDKKGILWAVAQQGLYAIKDEKIIDYYGFDAQQTTYKLPCKELFDVYQDEDGIFWIATNGEGLYRWDKQKNSFQQFTILEGLPSNILVRIEADTHGYLWIGTENGLCRFDTKTFTTNTYTTRDGLSHNEFNRISSFKTSHDRLYFGGLNGIVGFNPKDFLSDNEHFNAPLRVVHFAQFDGETQKIQDKTLEFLQQKRITLYPADRFLEITVQLLNYEEGENRYAYKVEGVDKEWHYITGNTLRLSGLPYGQFTLHVKAQNHWGTWSERQLQIPIEIITPIYLRRWFLIASVLLVGFSIFAFIRWRIYSIEQEKVVLAQIIELRTGELQSTLQEKELLLKELHHRIKNNFSLILSFVYFQSFSSQDDETVGNLNALHQRISSISVAHDLILQSYDKDFSEDSLYIDGYLHSVAQAVLGLDKREVILDFAVGKYLLNTDTSIPLGILLNELVSNSLKYAQPEGESLVISIKFSIENDTIMFYYTDNGTSFGENKRSNSLGTTIINSMVKQLKGKMQRTGSQYEFQLKIKNKK